MLCSLLMVDVQWQTSACILKNGKIFTTWWQIMYSIGGFEQIFISLLKSVAFSLQTSENNLEPH